MTAATCAACGAVLTPGAALAVTQRATGGVRHVHRPGLAPACFRTVAPANVEAIRLLDADAAAAFDRQQYMPRFAPRDDNGL